MTSPGLLSSSSSTSESSTLEEDEGEKQSDLTLFSESKSDCYSETLPPTQPLGESFDRSSTSATNGEQLPKIWGILAGCKKYFHDLPLRYNSLVVGRDSEKADYILKPPAIPEDCIDQFSRIHFRIHRTEENDVYITDESRNGTFVNGELVGRKCSRPLVHLDKIAITHLNREAFLFQMTTNSSNSRGVNEFRVSGDILRFYIVSNNLIGEGSCGKVYLGYCRRNSYEKVAVKAISKSLINTSNCESSNDLMAEVSIMKKLSHPCIIGIKDVFDEPRALYIVMELAKGGELFDFVYDDYQTKNLDERVAKFQFYQILRGMDYVHSKNVCHRDIKLENLLFKEKSRVSCIKITDFGLAKFIESNNFMSSFVGTLGYLAPEVVVNSTCTQGVYTIKADVWSLGCILYSLLTGSPAFYGENDNELKANIIAGKFDLHSVPWPAISPAAKHLIRRMLTKSVEERINTKEALCHPWFSEDPVIIQEAEAVMSGLKPQADESILPPPSFSASSFSFFSSSSSLANLDDTTITNDESMENNNKPRKRLRMSSIIQV